MYSNRYEAYKQQSVMTMTNGEMLHMLYEGAIKAISCAKIAFQNNQYVEINRQLQKAQEILLYLKKILDFKYPIAKNLESLYNYFIKVVRAANTKKDPAELDAVVDMLKELQATYDKADRAVRAKEA